MLRLENREGAITSNLNQKERKRSIWGTLSSERYFKWTLLIPLLIILSVFMFYPLFYSMFYSAQEWGGSGPSTFLGWDNFRSVLHDGVFWTTLGRTFEAMVICIAAELVIGMAMEPRVQRAKHSTRALPDAPVNGASDSVTAMELHVAI
jgi:ABC-type spermidine/putrescine transport system permease subunit I